MDHTGYYQYEADTAIHPLCGYVDNGAHFAAHFHRIFEMIYITKGNVKAVVGGELLVAGEGEFIVIPSYQTHCFLSPGTSEHFVLQIPQDYIAQFKKINDEKVFPHKIHPNVETTRRVDYALRLLSENADAETGWRCRDTFVNRGQIYTILGNLMETAPMKDKQKKSRSTPIRDILMYINDNYQGELTVKSLSEAFGYSQSRIYQIFKESVGINIPEYLSALRARAAVFIMIKNDEYSISDVAMEAGFKSTSTFYRIFRNSYGITPTDFMKLPEQEKMRLI